MSNYLEIPKELCEDLFYNLQNKPDDKGYYYLNEKLVEFIDNKIKVEVYSKEQEPPHFLLEYQNKKCRYRLYDCSPIDKEPRCLKDNKKKIQKWFKERQEYLIEFYNDNLPADAPPQARMAVV